MYIYIYVHTWRLAHFDVAVHMWLMYIYRYTHMHIYMCIYTCVMRILHVAQWMSHVAHVCHFHACCMRAHSKSRLTHVTHLNKSCHIYHLRMCHDAFRRVAGLIKCIMCVTWLVDIFDMTHSSLCYVCVTWQVDVLDTTHLRCMIWYMHICIRVYVYIRINIREESEREMHVCPEVLRLSICWGSLALLLCNICCLEQAVVFYIFFNLLYLRPDWCPLVGLGWLWLVGSIKS